LTEIEASDAFENILDGLEVTQGDCLMLGIDLGKIPLPYYKADLSREAFRNRERKWCRFVLDILLAQVGQHGTIVVPSFTYSCGSTGSIFNVKSTPSENGPFTEYFRRQPLASRSLHPIFSLAAIGKNSKDLLYNVGRSAFGAMSPYSRFLDFDMRFLCLGVELKDVITYIHHLEQNYGCPHRYNKTFDATVVAGNEKLTGEWYAYVAYRSFGYTSDISSLQNALQKSGDLIESEWNGQPNHIVNISAVNKVGYELLTMDSCSFVDWRMKFNFDELPDDLSEEINETTLRIRITDVLQDD